MLLDLLIPAAHAQSAAPQEPGFVTYLFLPLMLVVMYFLMIRPQQKRDKALKTLRTSLEVGDEVSTNAGILGKVKKVDESYVVLKVDDSVELKFQKEAILAVLPKGTIKQI